MTSRILWAPLALALGLGCAAHAPTQALHLDRVVLYQNGIGHFERSGSLVGDRLRLVLRPYEVDDVIKTLIVIDTSGVAQQVAAVLPTPDQSEGDRVVVDVVLTRPGSHLLVSYAVPTATWKTTYRVALPEKAGDPLLLQAWAMVDNVSEESWQDVRLTLATGAPLSYKTDLRSPHFVPRPDASGALVAPTATGVVTAERAHPGDRDGDAIADAQDMCPEANEDADGFEDADGCPDADNDRDGVGDDADGCPNEPETRNGFDDDDGCPDRGRVVVTSSAIEILDQIYFGPGSSTPAADAMPIIDAVAETLKGNPEIHTLAVAGHAARDESDPWGLSARRAAAVRAALLARGVTQPLEVRPFGDTMPIGNPTRDRRVEFEILNRGDDAPGGPGTVPRLGAATMAASTRSHTTAVEVAGATRYELGDRVTVPSGTSTLVSVMSKPIAGEDVFLFRPDGGVPGSDLHPLRAARLDLPAGLGLEPGPVAVFSDGSFAGEGLMQRTSGGEVNYIPYALDGGTTVRFETSGDELPQRLVKINRGVATVENATVRRTTFTIEAGATPTARIFLRFVPTPGFTVGELPPGTERGEQAMLIPVPLRASRTSTIVVEERQPVERQIEILDREGASVAMYLDGANLPDEVMARVKDIVAARLALGKVETEIDGLREALIDAGARSGDLEQSLTTVAKLPGVDAADLRRRLINQLTAATAHTDALAKKLASASARQVEARVKVQTALEALTLANEVSVQQ